MCLYLKIVSFTVFSCLLLIKLYILLIGAAVDFDDFTVFSPSRSQVTKLHFPRLYKFLVSIVNPFRPIGLISPIRNFCLLLGACSC